LVIVAAAAAVVAFVLSSIASGSGWLLAVAFTLPLRSLSSGYCGAPGAVL